MKFTKVSDPIVRKRVVNGYAKTKLLAFLEEFQKSDVDVAEVDSSDYSSSLACTAAIKAAIKRFGFNSLKCMTSDGKTYIINGRLLEKKTEKETENE